MTNVTDLYNFVWTLKVFFHLHDLDPAVISIHGKDCFIKFDTRTELKKYYKDYGKCISDGSLKIEFLEKFNIIPSSREN